MLISPTLMIVLLFTIYASDEVVVGNANARGIVERASNGKEMIVVERAAVVQYSGRRDGDRVKVDERAGIR